jgi:hypothetical protein
MMDVLRMLIIAYRPRDSGLGDFHLFCLHHAFWLLLLPLPVVCYSLITIVRGKVTVERFCTFASAVALVFVALLFTVLVCCLSAGLSISRL